MRPEDAVVALVQFEEEFSQNFHLVEPEPALLLCSMRLARHHGLRGYDAVQLASALHVNAVGLGIGLPPLTLVSADVELNAAAQAEGLAVENPNDHP